MAASKTLRITGDRKLIANMREIRKRSPKALAAGLYQEGTRIMSDSKEHYVPVDFGTLKGSGHVEQPVITDQVVKVELGYGGAASEYAVYVHENMTARHSVGQAKYLEAPLDAARSGMVERLGRSARDFLSRQGK